ncbi:acyl-CoA synthetase (AMP-forming)/AMP-acid ligase II [Nocardia transvalensis]|uniref:Acyl-CoA synthetase (AMP-forming)/AMP-acid ligase II n=1 Tax=Nocardia transvalensis TaxID=37333 RepID=A0A7W9PBY1_9NOCA|nr:AMP-binding protein [Nocardia transvalensis]MBB5913257.1 acyl-CoA synthetase (AMP-forming)/AMP-acid ligase II [Nocardia transvalensis]
MTTPAQTTPLALHETARRYGDATAVSDGDVRLSWARLLDEVRRTAGALIARGVEPGDRIAIWAPNTFHWVVAALATHYAGAALVPLNTRYVADEAADVLERVDAKALFVASPFLGRDRLGELRSTAPELGIETVIVIPGDEDSPDSPVFPARFWPESSEGSRPKARRENEEDGRRENEEDGRWEDEEDGRPEDKEDGRPEGKGAVVAWADLDDLSAQIPAEQVIARGESVGPEDISDILFTSGTTGRSKGTLVAHRQALDVVRAWCECSTLNSDDRYLVIPPFFHNFGYKAAMLACLVTGATIVPQATFDVPETMRLVHEQRITVLTGPPTIYQTILDHPARADSDLSSLRVAVTGAATVPVVLVERMRTDLKFDVVVTAYGLSESAGFGTMCLPDDDAETVANTSGGPIAGFEVRIDDNGEVLLRGPNVMLGYLDDPVNTAKTIDADGWLHTGDVGVLDERGYLKITDRLKDMYIAGGFNVYPAEIEQALARLDGVAESAVIGVPDERMGEVGKAYIVRRAGAALTEDDVIAFAKKTLANFKVPRYVEFRDQLPYSAAGKVLKRQLREEIS